MTFGWKDLKKNTCGSYMRKYSKLRTVMDGKFKLSDKKLPLLQKFEKSFANSEIFCPNCVCATITVPETIQSQMGFIQIASPVYFPERKVAP